MEKKKKKKKLKFARFQIFKIPNRQSLMITSLKVAKNIEGFFFLCFLEKNLIICYVTKFG